jgi:hypothetical protein
MPRSPARFRTHARVLLESDLYGSDEFKYDTLTEALAGVVRLARKASKTVQEDGIERRVILLVTSDSEEEG